MFCSVRGTFLPKRTFSQVFLSHGPFLAEGQFLFGPFFLMFLFSWFENGCIFAAPKTFVYKAHKRTEIHCSNRVPSTPFDKYNLLSQFHQLRSSFFAEKSTPLTSQKSIYWSVHSFSGEQNLLESTLFPRRVLIFLFA